MPSCIFLVCSLSRKLTARKAVNKKKIVIFAIMSCMGDKHCFLKKYNV